MIAYCLTRENSRAVWFCEQVKEDKTNGKEMRTMFRKFYVHSNYRNPSNVLHVHYKMRHKLKLCLLIVFALTHSGVPNPTSDNASLDVNHSSYATSLDQKVRFLSFLIWIVEPL